MANEDQNPKKEKISLEKKILQHPTAINIFVDGYDDIFSDFDARQYEVRALSDDFLLEAKKASHEKQPTDLELVFFVPSKERNANHEKIIRSRLSKHFKKHFQQLKETRKNVTKKGYALLAVGVIIMFITSYILFYNHEKDFFLNFFVVLLEPAGWFLFWEGSNMIFFGSKKETPDLEFYGKMSGCKISFESY